MLSGMMAHHTFHFREASAVLVLAAALALAGCMANEAASVTEASCKTTSVTFAGFGHGQADIQQDGHRL